MKKSFSIHAISLIVIGIVSIATAIFFTTINARDFHKAPPNFTRQNDVNFWLDDTQIYFTYIWSADARIIKNF